MDFSTRSVPNKAVSSLSDLAEAHFAWMLVRGYSADTVRARRVAMRRFLRWCMSHKLRRPRALTRAALEEYQRDVFNYRQPNGRPLALGTQQGFLAPLKTFMRWLHLEGHVPDNAAAEFTIPKQPKQLPRVLLSLREVNVVLAQASADDAVSLRDRALLELLYATGMRRTELANLTIHDVDPTLGRAFRRSGKGQRDRVVPTGTRSAGWLERYLKRSRSRLLRRPTDATDVVNDSPAHDR